MYNKRTEARKKLMAFTPVYESPRKALLGYVGDMTLKGVMVVGEKPLAVDMLLMLAIEFPENLPGVTDARVVVPARTARCVQEENELYFNIGFEFIDLSAENAAAIQAVLDRYQFRTVLSVSDLHPEADN